MRPDTPRYLFDLPGIYRIRMQGCLPSPESDGFGCMTNCIIRVRGHPPITSLTGALLDQASLMSVLTLLYDMGYPLLDLKRLPDQAASEAASARPVTGAQDNSEPAP